MEKIRNPIPTVDIIIELKIPPHPPFSKGGRGDWGIVLIERKNPPFGWAIPAAREGAPATAIGRRH